MWMKLICPKCKSINVQNSRRHAIEIVLQYAFSFVPFRCTDCWCRFYAFINPLRTSFFKIISACVILFLLFLSLPYIFKTVIKDKATTVGKSSTTPIPVKKQLVKSEEPGSTEMKGVSAVAEKEKLPVETAPVKTEERRDAQVKKANVQKSSQKAIQETASRPEPSEAGDKHDQDSSSGAVMSAVRSIVDVDIQFWESGIKVFLVADRPVTDYKYRFITSPPRLMIDLPGKWKKPTKPLVNTSNEKFKAIRFGLHAEKLRVVFDLKSERPVSPDVSGFPRGLLITLK